MPYKTLRTLLSLFFTYTPLESEELGRSGDLFGIRECKEYKRNVYIYIVLKLKFNAATVQAGRGFCIVGGQEVSHVPWCTNKVLFT